MCECDFCQTYDRYKWAVVMECCCGCHDDGLIEHDTLCCGIPNALRRNNPYNDLQSSEYYKTILKQIKDEWKSE